MSRVPETEREVEQWDDSRIANIERRLTELENLVSASSAREGAEDLQESSTLNPAPPSIRRHLRKHTQPPNTLTCTNKRPH